MAFVEIAKHQISNKWKIKNKGDGMKYTEKIHARRLLWILNKKNPCLCCPAAPKFSIAHHDSPDELWSSDSDSCKICQEFIGMEVERPNSTEKVYASCPCNNMSTHEVLKRTWLALEEKGYI